MEIGVLIRRVENHRWDGKERAKQQGRGAHRHHGGCALGADPGGQQLLGTADERELQVAQHIGNASRRRLHESAITDSCSWGEHETAVRNTRNHVGDKVFHRR